MKGYKHLTDEQTLDIQRRYRKAGGKYGIISSLAREFGVTKKTIHNALEKTVEVPEAERSEMTGWVYFARLGDLIKIGYSQDPESRAKILNAELIYAERGSVVKEKAYHRRFAALQESGEWFRAERPLMEWLGSRPPMRPLGTVKLRPSEGPLTRPFMAGKYGPCTGHLNPLNGVTSWHVWDGVIKVAGRTTCPDEIAYTQELAAALFEGGE